MNHTIEIEQVYQMLKRYDLVFPISNTTNHRYLKKQMILFIINLQYTFKKQSKSWIDNNILVQLEFLLHWNVNEKTKLTDLMCRVVIESIYRFLEKIGKFETKSRNNEQNIILYK
jgi:hypothetical protein